MKTILALLLTLALTLPAAGTLTGTNALNLQVVATATSNGTAFAVLNVAMPPRVFLIQHAGITGQVSSVIGTNSLKVNVQWSTDATNWTTLRTYTPAVTNAVVETYAPDLSTLTLYLRAQAVTTNTVTVGVNAIKP